ncbi:gamma DNA-directed DNA polymerase [Laetiporus sulphureus 93-53]|uniref:Mitochondrial DNA polymerase catalytic subunit n=1 Tax=Laetiporus sulphureus 93-53 TaxID=1314785 RepID=A0A165EHB6_9APHY|nr:gamma DNA-directed DNA polymerase [Laetiporus sulphureus 93-53]KZT07053.1 gamma DNA-directed DNA polymerase [Laetiporus sulphureus 93-53]
MLLRLAVVSRRARSVCPAVFSPLLLEAGYLSQSSSKRYASSKPTDADSVKRCRALPKQYSQHTAQPNNFPKSNATPTNEQQKKREGKSSIARSIDTGNKDVHNGQLHALPFSLFFTVFLGPKRNEVGVQLLSRSLHSQIFGNMQFEAPRSDVVQIAQEHLTMHGLDPLHGSTLPETDFTLPPLQGKDLDQHFHRIGARACDPWLRLAQTFARETLPEIPMEWTVQSGWTRHCIKNGLMESQSVDFPEFEGKPEEMLAFNVETLPADSPYPILACAASKNCWYSWISPWFLGEDDVHKHLIPIGGSEVGRVIVGHNVSYDRARILEEYNLNGTRNRFLDTMSLHVAVQGISSHQRPAWQKHRKSQEETKALRQRALEQGFEKLHDLIEYQQKKLAEEKHDTKKEEIRQMLRKLEDALENLQSHATEETHDDEEPPAGQWMDVTSVNSLAEVAKLHCGIKMKKAVGEDFKCSREEIRERIQDYLTYCATDVDVTHKVFAKILPSFLVTCPSLVSFAGMLTMGSSFLTVNQKWKQYIEAAEHAYHVLADKVQARLHELARDAMKMMDTNEWQSDLWLSQLDWTPKKAGKSRGVSEQQTRPSNRPQCSDPTYSWYQTLCTLGPLDPKIKMTVLPLLLELSFDGHPLQYSSTEWWYYVPDGKVTLLPERIKVTGASTTKRVKLKDPLGSLRGRALFDSGHLKCKYPDLADAIYQESDLSDTSKRILEIAEKIARRGPEKVKKNISLKQLDWEPVEGSASPSTKRRRKTLSLTAAKPAPVMWPKWFWDSTTPKKGMELGSLDLTVRSRIAPILLRLRWRGWPLFYSHKHGWTFRVDPNTGFDTRTKKLEFHDPEDSRLQADVEKGHAFYKLPHKDGEKANVGSPLGKTFMKYAQDGTLTSPEATAAEALDISAQCSYWISARDRIKKQMVVWQKEHDLGFSSLEEKDKDWGIILPQVITMGTITRRAIEKTWLTASNAKKNRVGSELKAMVTAPPGYAIVGADVDSEELWISSVMGDAQFGLHGATALGWMTLEGTKAAGTDLHSKTASILGISRDQAKVFNYSRIYGASMRYVVLLLLESNANMSEGEAQRLARNMYASAKGHSTRAPGLHERQFWHGGSESFVFNKLEDIALCDEPRTPALGCGMTYALSTKYLPTDFGSNYMTSRINWVVQSSGVDYLHLLIVSMDHLIKRYGIKARYLISVHDELRYLVKKEDRYRAALALQIANLWTRSLFALKLGMDDLPQGVAFFSSVDIDHVLRKEVNMPCVTPSHPEAISPGESVDITQVLEKTNGSLWAKDESGQTRPMEEAVETSPTGDLRLTSYVQPDWLKHRATSIEWLKAQATADVEEIEKLAGGPIEKPLGWKSQRPSTYGKRNTSSQFSSYF